MCRATARELLVFQGLEALVQTLREHRYELILKILKYLMVNLVIVAGHDKIA